MRAPAWAQTLLDFANALRCSEAVSYAGYLDSGVTLNPSMARKAVKKICAVDPSRLGSKGVSALAPMEGLLLMPFQADGEALTSAKEGLSREFSKMSDKRRSAWSVGLEGATIEGSWGEAMLSALRPELARAQANEIRLATRSEGASAARAKSSPKARL